MSRWLRLSITKSINSTCRPEKQHNEPEEATEYFKDMSRLVSILQRSLLEGRVHERLLSQRTSHHPSDDHTHAERNDLSL